MSGMVVREGGGIFGSPILKREELLRWRWQPSAFFDEVATTSSPFYVLHVLQFVTFSVTFEEENFKISK
jgi:hypothetical protein